MTIGQGGAEHVVISQLYVPGLDIVATREEAGGWVWTRPLPETSSQLQRVSQGARPFPARRLPASAVRRDPPRRPAPAVSTAGAPGGGMPAWTWPLGALAVLLAAWAARTHMRA